MQGIIVDLREYTGETLAFVLEGLEDIRAIIKPVLVAQRLLEVAIEHTYHPLRVLDVVEVLVVMALVLLMRQIEVLIELLQPVWFKVLIKINHINHDVLALVLGPLPLIMYLQVTRFAHVLLTLLAVYEGITFLTFVAIRVDIQIAQIKYVHIINNHLFMYF